MKLFFTHKEIALKKKRTALVVIGIGLVIGIYLIVSHQPAKMPELPVVAIAPATQDDVEIYGEYVGRVRAQQFVEVRARVEGYLEQMLSQKVHMSLKIKCCLLSIKINIGPKLTKRAPN